MAYFCLHASRLYCQITKFLEESLHVAHLQQSVRSLCEMVQFPEEKELGSFIFEEEDLQEKLRKDVRACRAAFASKFKQTIPILDRDGRLVLRE